MTAGVTTLLEGPSRPVVKLLDARRLGLGERALRERARREGQGFGGRVTRSYRYPYALVARHGEAVGADLERVEDLDRAFVDSISTPGERASRELEALSDGQRAAALWSSKEALAKALGDPLRYDPRRLESPLRWPRGRSGPWRACSLEVPEGYVGWACWRATSLTR